MGCAPIFFNSFATALNFRSFFMLSEIFWQTASGVSGWTPTQRRPSKDLLRPLSLGCETLLPIAFS